eukprot:Sspe_Gene.16208::Locus_5709_Transcript_1_1_Confidence_1.000_Length_2838::g.16208::m.16208/K14293/KPNB1, IPO1; importin subunit beta-1
MADLTTLLSNALSGNQELIQASEKVFKEVELGSIQQYYGALMQELASEDKPSRCRKLAAQMIKNAMDDRWLTVAPEARQQIKQMATQTLSSADIDSGKGAAAVIAAIAKFEFPRNEWPGFMKQLCEAATQTENNNLREASLTCIGWICQDVPKECLQQNSSEIITAVVKAMRKEEPNQTIRQQGTRALMDSLEFIEGIMETPDRAYLMHVLMETASRVVEAPHVPAEPETRTYAMQCLVQIVSLYYERIEEHMRQLYNITFDAVTNDVEQVALQGVEFWDALARTEHEIIGMQAMGEQIACNYYIKGAIKYLAQLLWDTILKSEVPAGNDEWCMHSACGVCLESISQCIGDAVVEHIMPYVHENIGNHQSWKHMEAATYVFACILEGTTPTGPLAPLMNDAIPTLVDHMQKSASQPALMETTTWCLGRIAEFHGDQLRTHHLRPVLAAMLESLKPPVPPFVSEKACYAIIEICRGCTDVVGQLQQTNVMSPYIRDMLTNLFIAVDRQDASQTQLRQSAWDTMGAVVSCCAQDTLQVVVDLLPIVLERLQTTTNLIMQLRASGQKIPQEGSSIQGMLCGLLQNACLKLGPHPKLLEMKDVIMGQLLALFSSNVAEVQEEAYLAVSAMAQCLKKDFVHYMQDFAVILCRGLQNVQFPRVCSMTVEVTKSLAAVLGASLQPYCNDIVGILLENLKSKDLSMDVKPKIISCFGDIAFAIDEHFVAYLPRVMSVIHIAVQTVQGAAASDEQMAIYQNEIWENVCSAYTCILLGMKNCQAALTPYVTQMLEHVALISMKRQTIMPEVYINALTVVGDLANVYRTEIKEQLKHEAIMYLVMDGKNHKDEGVRKAADMAIEEIQQC